MEQEKKQEQEPEPKAKTADASKREIMATVLRKTVMMANNSVKANTDEIRAALLDLVEDIDVATKGGEKC